MKPAPAPSRVFNHAEVIGTVGPTVSMKDNALYAFSLTGQAVLNAPMNLNVALGGTVTRPLHTAPDNKDATWNALGFVSVTGADPLFENGAYHIIPPYAQLGVQANLRKPHDPFVAFAVGSGFEYEAIERTLLFQFFGQAGFGYDPWKHLIVLFNFSFGVNAVIQLFQPPAVGE